jgi:hypothetical protein
MKRDPKSTAKMKWGDLTINLITSANETAQEMLAILARIAEEAGLKVSQIEDKEGITIPRHQGGLVVAYVPSLTEDAWRAIEEADKGGLASFLIYNARHIDQMMRCRRGLQACACSVGLIGEVQRTEFETIVREFRKTLSAMKTAARNVKPVN